MGRTMFDTLETWGFQQLEDLSCTHLKLSTNRRTHLHTLSQISKLKFSTIQRTFFHTLLTFKNLKKEFSTLEKLTTLWRNLFHTSHSLGNVTIALYATTWKCTLFATLQIKSLPSKGFSLSMLYKLNLWLLFVLTQCLFSCLVWAHNLLETTWKQAKNETLEVHEMEHWYYLIKRLQRLYASNATIIQLWLAITNKVWRFYVHSKPWKEKMNNSLTNIYIYISP